MKREHFVKVVEEVLDSIPQEFRSRIRNVAVLVEDTRLYETLSTWLIPRTPNTTACHSSKERGFRAIPV